MNKLNVPLDEVIKKENEQKGPEAMGTYIKSRINGVKYCKRRGSPSKQGFHQSFCRKFKLSNLLARFERLYEDGW